MPTNHNSVIAPELLERISRLPGLYVKQGVGGHIYLFAATPEGLADRTVVLGKGANAVKTLHFIVTMIEGVLAHMGYEDPASARIDMSRWVSIRWLRTELDDSGVDIRGFREVMTERGNEIIQSEFYQTEAERLEGQIRRVLTRNLTTGLECEMSIVVGVDYDSGNDLHVEIDEGWRGVGIAYWSVPQDVKVGYMLDEVTEIISI